MCSWNRAYVYTDAPELKDRTRDLLIHRDVEDERETAESVAAEEESIDKLRAKTMYNMVSDFEIDGMRRKLLFLTNSQADFLASSDDSLQKMLDALEVPKPQLVINLLLSLLHAIQ